MKAVSSEVTCKQKKSTVSMVDKTFIDFCRCLYQAKAVVRELESFSNSVLCPAIKQLSIENQTIAKYKYDSNVLLKQVHQYLHSTFRKFTRLCNILMVVLTRMESGSAGKVKKERIDSFRVEVWEEWKMATDIKQRLIYYITTQQQSLLLQRNDEKAVGENQTVYTTTTTTITTTTTTTTTTNNTNTNSNKACSFTTTTTTSSSSSSSTTTS